MKKLIIMSLAFFALALVSCKSKDKDCPDGEKWDKEKEECVKEAPAQDQASCEEDGTKKWDDSKAEGEKCVAKNEAECTATEGDKVEWKEGACVAKAAADAVVEYSITNGIEGRTVRVTSGTATKDLAYNACLLVTAEQAKALKAELVAIAADATATPPVTAQDGAILCDSSDTATDNDCQAANGMAMAAVAPATGHVLSQTGVQKPDTCTDKLTAPAAS